VRKTMNLLETYAPAIPQPSHDPATFRAQVDAEVALRFHSHFKTKPGEAKCWPRPYEFAQISPTRLLSPAHSSTAWKRGRNSFFRIACASSEISRERAGDSWSTLRCSADGPIVSSRTCMNPNQLNKRRGPLQREGLSHPDFRELAGPLRSQ